MELSKLDLKSTSHSGTELSFVIPKGDLNCYAMMRYRGDCVRSVNLTIAQLKELATFIINNT